MIASEVVAPNGRPVTRRAPSRVLHVHSGNLYGGVETFLRTLATNAKLAPSVAMDFAVCFDDRVAGELREAGAVVHVIGPVRIRSPLRVAAARGALRAIVRDGGYDAIVCHSAWSHALFARTARERGARLAFYMHDVPNRRGWLDHWAQTTTPDVVFCNSAFTQDAGAWMFRGVPREMLRCPLGPRPPASAAARASLRASLGAREDALVVFQATRVQRWKGHLLLLEALAELRDDPRWVCWIAGGVQRAEEAAYARELEAAVARLGLASRVRFLGQRADVPALMRAADVYCQPNIGPETFGLAFVEALAAGLPVVTTPIGGALEIVTDACGVLAEARPAAVASAIRAVFDDPARRRAAAQAGPARARELCDLESRMHDIDGALDRLASPGDGAPSLAVPSDDAAVLRAIAVALELRGARLEDAVQLHGAPGEAARFAPASASVVLALSVVERVENPRAVLRDATRLARPGGWIVATTPNNLSLRSKASLFALDRFDGRGALLEGDMMRMAEECGLSDVAVLYAPRPDRWFATTAVLLGRRP